MCINPSIYCGKPFQCLFMVLLQVIEVFHCKFNMIKTKQTKRKLEAEKERQEKYRIAKVPSRFGTVAKVATHDTPVYQVSQVLQGIFLYTRVNISLYIFHSI